MTHRRAASPYLPKLGTCHRHVPARSSRTHCGRRGSASASRRSAPRALTAAYLAERYPNARCLLLSSGDIRADRAAVRLVAGDDPAPDVVVLGGVGPEFSYDAINQVFTLQRGARLVTMHRNQYWQPTRASTGHRRLAARPGTRHRRAGRDHRLTSRSNFHHRTVNARRPTRRSGHGRRRHPRRRVRRPTPRHHRRPGQNRQVPATHPPHRHQQPRPHPRIIRPTSQRSRTAWPPAPPQLTHQPTPTRDHPVVCTPGHRTLPRVEHQPDPRTISRLKYQHALQPIHHRICQRPPKAAIRSNAQKLAPLRHPPATESPDRPTTRRPHSTVARG